MIAKAQTKKAPGGKTVTVIQTGSFYGNKRGMSETLLGLGLGKPRAKCTLEDTPAVRGMIFKVKHLVKVEEGK